MKPYVGTSLNYYSITALYLSLSLGYTSREIWTIVYPRTASQPVFRAHAAALAISRITQSEDKYFWVGEPSIHCFALIMLRVDYIAKS